LRDQRADKLKTVSALAFRRLQDSSSRAEPSGDAAEFNASTSSLCPAARRAIRGETRRCSMEISSENRNQDATASATLSGKRRRLEPDKLVSSRRSKSSGRGAFKVAVRASTVHAHVGSARRSDSLPPVPGESCSEIVIGSAERETSALGQRRKRWPGTSATHQPPLSW
jgi:hypothetical protein